LSFADFVRPRDTMFWNQSGALTSSGSLNH
jgi:hypothetical protein